MSERMSSADVAFLLRETRTTPQHVGGLAIFTTPPDGFSYERLISLLERRVPLAPRYRQKVRTVPGRLANPVWVDDPDFDITYHVRRSMLPRPGGEQQLLDFCARIQARLLDRARPLWEMYLVEGLAATGVSRFAIVTKTHAAVVGERDGIDLAQVVLDNVQASGPMVDGIWMPDAEPSSLALLGDALRTIASSPIGWVRPVRSAAAEIGDAALRATALATGALSTVGIRLGRAPASPLVAELGEQRRLALARTALDDYRLVRETFGGSVNDVVLAVVAGALRGWLMSRAVPLRPATTVRVLLPVSVVDPPQGARTAANDSAGAEAAGVRYEGLVQPLQVDLPVGEPDPLLRLAQVRYALATHKATGRAVAADRPVALHGFAPPTLHALGLRTAGELSRRQFSLVLTNVPGPQLPMYADSARLTEFFPILPLTGTQALSIALTSYTGAIFYGINADRDAVRDVGLVGELIEESLVELVAAAQGATHAGEVGVEGRRRTSKARSGTASRSSSTPRSRPSSPSTSATRSDQSPPEAT